MFSGSSVVEHSSLHEAMFSVDNTEKKEQLGSIIFHGASHLTCLVEMNKKYKSICSEIIGGEI